MSSPVSFLCHPLGPRVTCTCDGQGVTLGCVPPGEGPSVPEPWSPTQLLLSLTLALILVFTAIR